MDRKRSDIVQYIIITVLGIVIAGILFYMIPYRYNLNSTATYDLDPNYIDNPLMGFAPRADMPEVCGEVSLVYIDIRWADWEPEKGKYDIESLENRYNISRWKEEHKHAILRFVCDVPGDESHIDIPQWLFDEIHDGTMYSHDYGKGYSPNYTNEKFIDYHKQAISALAEYCNKDFFISFVELGSLGHWGEWHAKGSKYENLMPDKEVCQLYAEHYSDNFVNAILLTRRNYDFAVNYDMGVFNDMTGSRNDTKEWLDWIDNGGEQETSGKPLQLIKMNQLGKERPVGGEFASNVVTDGVIGEKLGDILSMISSTNMTFIGPMVPDMVSEDYATVRQSIRRRMGYRIYISKLETQYNFANKTVDIYTTWNNGGNAGFFFDWPVTLNLYDADKNLIYWQTIDLDLRDLNSEKNLTVGVSIPYSGKIRDEFYIGIEINDYDGNEGLKLAIDMEEELGDVDNCQLIYHYKR